MEWLAFPRITFHLKLKGDKEMEYRIEEKEPFTVVGKAIQVSCRDGEHMRRIPHVLGRIREQWHGSQACLHEPDGTMLGICMDFQQELELLTYMIASRTEADTRADTSADEFTVHTIPAYTWAIFPCVGPIPGAIQSLFARIFQEWFPATGYEHAAGPELEVYPPGDTTAEDYRCEVWIPIVKR